MRFILYQKNNVQIDSYVQTQNSNCPQIWGSKYTDIKPVNKINQGKQT